MSTIQDCFYLLLRGAVKVTARSNFGKEVILTTEVAGFYFGEVALLGDTVRTACEFDHFMIALFFFPYASSSKMTDRHNSYPSS